MRLTSQLKTILCAAVVLTGVSAITASPASAQRSLEAYCDDYAVQAARSRGRGRVLGGSAVGAATGAIIGGILGGGRGAAIGAGTGAAAGAIGGQASKRGVRDNVYWAAYNDCIAENSRGRRRPAPTRAGYEPWTPAWYDYCSSRYRTFNPETGYYFYKPGRQRFCR